MSIKNLSQLKRAVKVGTELICLENVFGVVPEAERRRVVIAVQQNGLWVRLPYLGEDSKRRWIEYGKASAYSFREEGFTIQHGNKQAVYEYVKETLNT
jgi:hypothetical protein